MQTIRRWLGIELDEVSWREKVVSMLGGGVAIMAVIAVSHHLLGYTGAAMLIRSMGASAVLLFAVPHGSLSQPWPVFGGHLLSALTGVTCAKVINSTELAAACAVGISIGLMHQCKCIHPPGGATALTAVVAGPAVTSLGYSFVWRPVVINVITILAVAVVFNLPLRWRRYPAFLNRHDRAPDNGEAVTHDDIVAALREIDSFVDVTEADLVRLVDIVSRRHRQV